MDLPATSYALLRDIKREDRREAAWAAFQRQYGDVILAWCRRRGLTLHTAEDLTQEVLLKLFHALPKHEHDPTRGLFRSWLKTVVENAIRDYRAARSRQVVGVSGLDWSQVGDPHDTIEELSTAIEARAGSQAQDVLSRVRARVEEKSWQAFFQTAIEHRPAMQVARELGLAVATVYKHTYRVKQKLLEEYQNVFRVNPTAVDGRAGVST